MRATSAITSDVSTTSKAVRRPASNWTSHSQTVASRHRMPGVDAPQIVRFPENPEQRAERENEIARRARMVRSSWNEAEKAQRRVQAIAKQEELMMLLSSCALEDTLRRAVADGEQPVMPPEIEALA